MVNQDTQISQYIPYLTSVFATACISWGLWLLIASPEWYEYEVSRQVDLVVLILGGSLLISLSLGPFYIRIIELRREVSSYAE